jgi:2'-5' RNA ligase
VHADVAAVLDPRDWKLHAPEDLHLTLCFLGDVAADRLPALASALGAELTNQPTPQLALARTDVFGPPASPRILHLRVDAEPTDLERLLTLRTTAARVLAAHGIAWDSAGPFTPHVTLARPRRKAAPPAEFADLRFDHAWRPAALSVFESVPGGRPHYARLGSVQLLGTRGNSGAEPQPRA